MERLSTEYSLAEERANSEITGLKGRLEQEQFSAKSAQAELASEINVISIEVGIKGRHWNQSWKY